jgi:hypothetical protein
MDAMCHDEEALRTHDLVLDSPDLLACIAKHVGSGDLLAWALTCRRFRTAQKATGRVMASHAGALVASVNRVLWATTWTTFPLDTGMVCWMAARAGRLDVLKWARSRGLTCDWRAFSNAAACGHVDVMRWLYSEGVEFGPHREGGVLDAWFNPIQPRTLICGQVVPNTCDSYAGACARAAANGHLDALIWLRSKGCWWAEDTLDVAAMGGHIEVLRWAWENGCPRENERICNHATQGGQLEVLRWARENGCWGNPEFPSPYFR